MTTETLTDMVASLSQVVDAAGDQERIDQIRLLEELKSAAAAAQARIVARFVDSQRAAQQAAGCSRDGGRQARLRRT